MYVIAIENRTDKYLEVTHKYFEVFYKYLLCA